MKRNGYLFIILFLYTTPILGIGKDNPDSLQAVRECLSPLFAFGEKSYANPALQPYARQFSLSSLRLSGEYKNEKEAVIVQQGSGYRQGVFRAESYLHEIIDIIREAGIVGMGGAGFPTCVKLKPAKPVDTILLNGCECEPLLTADHRVLLEYADDIIFGLKAVLKTTGAEKGIIVIEDNKPDAIELMQKKVADIGNMEVFVAKTKYPQ